MSFLADRRVRHWLANAFQSRSWERFDSLPITRIDSRFEPRDAWLAGARWCLERAESTQRRVRYPLAIAVSIELREAEAGTGLPGSPAELEEALGENPPALTAFAPGGEFDDLARESPFHPSLIGLDPRPELVCATSSWSFPDDAAVVFRALYAGFHAPT